MAVKAIGFRAVVRPDKFEEITKGGIVLAVDEKMEMNAQTTGVIVELGEDFAKDFKPRSPYWGLQPGDRVFYAKYAGKWVKDPVTNEELLILNDEDIMAKAEGEPSDGSNVVASKEA